jgi:predicted ATPase
MLKSLHLKNFSVFEEGLFAFSPGLNVIIGENGTGKSQLMKLAYAVSHVSHSQISSTRKNKEDFQRALADKIVAVCKPESLGRLVTRQVGRNRCEVAVDFVHSQHTGFDFNFSTQSKAEVKVEKMPDAFVEAAPVFFPTREMMSVYEGFAGAYRNRELSFDETYYDLVIALDASVKKKHPASIVALIKQFEVLMGGAVRLENGRFYLIPEQSGKGKIEMPLVAEGIRKLAMLAYLLLNGALRDKGTLFWDEPETNLNPRLMRALAQALVLLATQGYQVVLATHSLFLLRELAIELETTEKHKSANFIGLCRNERGSVTAQSAPSLSDIDCLVLLDEDLNQTDRYLALP